MLAVSPKCGLGENPTCSQCSDTVYVPFGKQACHMNNTPEDMLKCLVAAIERKHLTPLSRLQAFQMCFTLTHLMQQICSVQAQISAVSHSFTL